MKKNKIILIIFGVLYLLFLTGLEDMVRERSQTSVLKEHTIESEKFREQRLDQKVYQMLQQKAEKNEDWIELLTSSMLDSDFHPEKISDSGKMYRKYKKKEYETLKKAYGAVWEDVRYFPVASREIFFENSWMAKRSYGGSRFHEGCDLFGKITESGYYPIISMTDGVVEKTGWLPLGGYRIGIRTDTGGYFYYAHLASYEKNFYPGEIVKAGDILGYMGNTGYGPVGTKGKFPVHLHLGIYVPLADKKEVSVNPYWLLKIFTKKTTNYTY